MSDARVTIVDPYSSGAMLAEELISLGVPCLAVESSPATPDAMKSKFDPGMFDDVVLHTGDFAGTLQRVKRQRPSHILAGFESGVELAERLSEELSLPTNYPCDRRARRDKFAMAERVRQCGLRTPKQFCSRDCDEILRWVESELCWPVIVKPSASVASDHVHRCVDRDQLRNAVSAILSQPNILGLSNERVVVQEYLVGTEYAVDVVCGGGARVVTAIWQYHRPDAAGRFVCYDAMTLMPYDGIRQRELRAFTFAVLDALGIRQGPAHCELMRANGRLVLLEVGARLSAGVNSVLSQQCGGIGQLEKTLQVILEPERFAAEASVQPVLRRYAANVFLMPPCPGRLVQTHRLSDLHSLPTLHSLSVASTPGLELDRVAGIVTLVDEDRAAIERDMARIRELEREGMFEVAP